MSDDRKLGMGRSITRRDFIDGVAAGAAVMTLPAGAHAAETEYPPALTGLRGSHAGSFEAAHALAFQGQGIKPPPAQTDDTYDLVVVGAGLSGLATAFFYRQKVGPNARILILDNHDDFGGHAKRNEFHAGDRLLIGYGGSQSMENPRAYSEAAKRLLADLGVDLKRFYSAFDQNLYPALGLGAGLYFDRATSGVDRVVVPGGPRGLLVGGDVGRTANGSLDWIDQVPMSERGRADLRRLFGAGGDPLPDLDRDAKLARLEQISYADYLRTIIGLGDEALAFVQALPLEYWAFGADGLSALEALKTEYPGFAGLGLDGAVEKYFGADNPVVEPYIFHFPDGNASLARLMVRALIPDAIPGSTMDDIVLAPCDYDRLDRDGSPNRLRLKSIVLDVRHVGEPSTASEVDLSYLRDGSAYRVRARHVVLACYNMMIPHLCRDMPQKQKDGLKYLVKLPLVYANVLIREWTSFVRLGLENAYCPGSYYCEVALDFPVSLGGYRGTSDPAEPIVVHLVRVPMTPGAGLTVRDEARRGRAELLATPFATYERELRAQLNGMLSSAGFDAARDIMAITVNRWPHGYAYEYNTLFDPEWPEGEAPHEIGRRRFGRIHIANSDSEPIAYADAAIDAADRAVAEILE